MLNRNIPKEIMRYLSDVYEYCENVKNLGYAIAFRNVAFNSVKTWEMSSEEYKKICENQNLIYHLGAELPDRWLEHYGTKSYIDYLNKKQFLFAHMVSGRGYDDIPNAEVSKHISKLSWMRQTDVEYQLTFNTLSKNSY